MRTETSYRGSGPRGVVLSSAMTSVAVRKTLTLDGGSAGVLVKGDRRVSRDPLRETVTKGKVRKVEESTGRVGSGVAEDRERQTPLYSTVVVFLSVRGSERPDALYRTKGIVRTALLCLSPSSVEAYFLWQIR